MNHVSAKSKSYVDDDDELNVDNDAVWGAAQIGKEINRTADQVRYLFKRGELSEAVRKAGHRTYLGSRRRLRQLAQTI
jgi:hypothetical protein